MVKIRMQPGETWLPLRTRQRSPAAQPRAARPTGAGAAQRSHAPPQGAPCAAASPAARRKGARLAHPRALRGACPGALRIGARAGAAPLAQRGHQWPQRRPPSGAAANCSRCAAQGLRPRLHAGITQNVACCPARTEPGWTTSNTLLCNVAMRPSQPPRACGPPCPPAGAARPPAPVASRQQQRAESEKMRGRCPRRPRARR